MVTRYRRCLAAALAVFVICLPLPAAEEKEPKGVYVAPDPEPTPEETLILEYINRGRADPKAESARIAPPGKKIRGVEVDMFRKEMDQIKASAPLVFNLDLLKAARRHAHYQILNGQGHDEVLGKKGFSGANPGERVRAVGYRFRGVAENVFVHGRSPRQAHEEFIVDRGPGGTGGMQPGRGHRVNIFNEKFREYGGSYLRHSNKASVTQLFGTRGGGRFVGGVAYVDKNNNKFYDIGEGMGAIQMTAGGKTAKTWKSGAYSLAIGEGAVAITAVYNDLKYTRLLPSGSDNVKFDFIIPQTADVKRVQAMLRMVKRYGNTKSKARFRAILNLILNTQNVVIDDGTRAEIKEVSAGVAEQLEKDREAAREAMKSEDMNAARKTLMALRTNYSMTPAFNWFNDAVRCTWQRARYLGLITYKEKLKPGAKPNPAYLASAVKAFRKEVKSLKTEEWQKWLEDLATEAESLW